ncbi:sugar phosphate isomerase/epimerase family protein [Streptomyces sp. NPDC001340]
MTWRATSRAWHAEDIRRSIRLAERLGQHRVVTMSGLPGCEPGASRPNWIVNAWNSAALDVLDHQWRIVAYFWRETGRLARDHDVKVALELHPQNVVFNGADVHRLIELTVGDVVALVGTRRSRSRCDRDRHSSHVPYLP